MLKVIPIISKKIMVIMAVMLFTVSMILFISPGKIYGATIDVVPGDGTPIQAAIDAATAGDTINISAGTYNEQLLIDGKNLTIQSEDDPVITGVSDGEYIIKVVNSDVTLDGLKVNGNEKNVTNGIWYYNAGGEVKDCTVQGLEREHKGTAIRIENSAVDVTSNLLKEFLRNGIFVRDAGSSGITIFGNEIICHSIDDVDDAYHGIEVSWGAQDITIQDNTIYDSVISTLGLLNWDWSSQGIVVWGQSGDPIMTSSANILGNTIHHVMEGIHIGYQQLDGDTSYALIRGNYVYDCLWGIGVVSDANADIESNTVDMLDQVVIAFAAGSGECIWVGGGWSGSFVEEPTATITGNTLNNCDMGIDLYENADITATGNTITNCDYGIKTNSSNSETWSQTVVANSNNIVGNLTYGIDNTANSPTINATNNWWGNASGPSGDGPGTGDAVSTNVNFIPWLTNPVGYVAPPSGASAAPTAPNYVQQTVGAGTHTVDASAVAGASATITGSGGQTVTIEGISSATASEKGFLIEGATTYVDLHLDSSEGAEQIQFTILGGAGVPRWWNGTSWIECSDYTIDAAGNVTTTITNLTTPSLSDLTGTVFTVVPGPVRTHDKTCWQIYVNEEGNFEFVFWWEYWNNNWVKIYDMNGNEVFSIDMPYGGATFAADLPDGIYTVKTFHSKGDILQEFVIGKP